jgi:hypothetical protein
MKQIFKSMEIQCKSSWTTVHEFFCPEAYDVGALSSKHKWKITQHPSMNFEVFLNFKVGISIKYLENIVIKEHLKFLEDERSHEIDGGCILFNVVDGSTDLKHSLLSICLEHLL